jgi:D-apiose dehydrogenase
MSYRSAIAGLGACARRIHLPAYNSIPALEIVGGRDPLARAEDFSFPIFPSVPEMLEKTKPDILAVVTPPDSHFHITSLGLRAGYHVFCEKPFVNSLKEADGIIALSKDAGRQVVVNNQFRFMRVHRAAKEKIGRPEFGDLLFVSMAQTEAGWRGQDSQRTAKEFGTHALELCRYFFDENPTSISARMPRGGQPKVPDYLDLIQLEFSRDRVAHITLDRLYRGRHRYPMSALMAKSDRSRPRSAADGTDVSASGQRRGGLSSASIWRWVAARGSTAASGSRCWPRNQ